VPKKKINLSFFFFEEGGGGGGGIEFSNSLRNLCGIIVTQCPLIKVRRISGPPTSLLKKIVSTPNAANELNFIRCMLRM